MTAATSNTSRVAFMVVGQTIIRVEYGTIRRDVPFPIYLSQIADTVIDGGSLKKCRHKMIEARYESSPNDFYGFLVINGESIPSSEAVRKIREGEL